VKRAFLIFIIALLTAPLTAKPEESGAMEYASPAVYIDPQSPENIEERIILMSVHANLCLESWDDPMDIDPDHLFEYYEAMVIFGETEKLAGLEYIPAETVYSVIQQHFDITESLLKENSYYDSEQDGFYVGGLGNVVDAVIEGIAIEEQNTVISYALYFQDELHSRGKLTVNIEDDGYKFLSNEMLE